MNSETPREVFTGPRLARRKSVTLTTASWDRSRRGAINLCEFRIGSRLDRFIVEDSWAILHDILQFYARVLAIVSRDPGKAQPRLQSLFLIVHQVHSE